MVDTEHTDFENIHGVVNETLPSDKDKLTLIEEHGILLPLLPLKNVVMLPKSIQPILVGRKSSIAAVEYALAHDKALFITAQKDTNVEAPTLADVYIYGTRSVILQTMRLPNGSIKIFAEGICRAKIVQAHAMNDFLAVVCEDIPTPDLALTVEIEALWRQLKELYIAYAKLNEKAPIDIMSLAKTAQDMDYIADTIAVHIQLNFDERQTLLETPSLYERLLKLCSYIQKEIEILETEQRIKGRIQTQVEKSQREYYLTEQMKAIQKELGRDDQALEIANLQEQIQKMPLSSEAREKVEKELHRLEQMPPLSAEAVVSRNYIDWIISLPWGKYTKDTISIRQAEKMLNEHHAGLKKVKERIIEFLAAKKFAKQIERSPIICLVGPPGVGKTSLARSIADSLGRSFARISLGGVKDEAEIRGHRRTYIGALPGKIIQAIKKSKTMNPVILLDEIDKMAKDIQGDPASALLEVLDPEQNKTFTDHFLDIEFDLSNVMFITTANSLDRIPLPLFDRMEIIQLSGYTAEEKLDIAKKFLIPKNLAEYGLNATQFKIADEQIRTIILRYTQEAGVRQLERIITKLMRKTIQELLKDKKAKSVHITEELIKEWLGYPKFRKTSLNERKERIGIATGLAWTEFGGDVLEIEATAIPGKGSLLLTGQLGEVMQESAQAALSYIRSRTKELGLKSSFYSTKDIHIHIPEGATPKDGPSAGITMCVALISALTQAGTRPHLAMTGEITLQGRVLAIGGLKEKLLAARQHEIKEIIIPRENEDDLREIEKEVELSDIKITMVSTMDEVLQHAFTTSILKEQTRKNNSDKKTKNHL
jgi:ATP-dependent Lon protease